MEQSLRSVGFCGLRFVRPFNCQLRRRRSSRRVDRIGHSLICACHGNTPSASDMFWACLVHSRYAALLSASNRSFLLSGCVGNTHTRTITIGIVSLVRFTSSDRTALYHFVPTLYKTSATAVSPDTCCPSALFLHRHVPTLFRHTHAHESSSPAAPDSL